MGRLVEGSPQGMETAAGSRLPNKVEASERSCVSTLGCLWAYLLHNARGQLQKPVVAASWAPWHLGPTHES